MLVKGKKYTPPLHFAGVVVAFLCSMQFCMGQLTNTVYEDFNRTIVNPYLVNPSATDTTHSFKLRFNNINQLGLFKNVRRFYLDGNKRFPSADKNDFHFAGLQMTNSKLGDFINKSRLKLRYSYVSRISEKAAISSGISLGFINYALLTTKGGRGGSDFGPDGAVGIHYIRGNTSVGVAVKQIFNSVLIPVNQSFELKRLYNADITHRFRLTRKIDLTAQSVVQMSENRKPSYSFGLMSGISDVVLLGVNHFSLRETSLQAGLQKIRFLDMDFNVLFAYSMYHSNISLPDNSLEIFVSLEK